MPSENSDGIFSVGNYYNSVYSSMEFGFVRNFQSRSGIIAKLLLSFYCQLL